MLMHFVPLLGDATWLGKCIQGSLSLHWFACNTDKQAV